MRRAFAFAVLLLLITSCAHTVTPKVPEVAFKQPTWMAIRTQDPSPACKKNPKCESYSVLMKSMQQSTAVMQTICNNKSYTCLGPGDTWVVVVIERYRK